MLFSYDANGNPVSVEDTTANTLRVMQWDEENRLQSLGDDGYVSRYTYNHAGERVIKSHGPTTVAFVNGAPQGILWHDKDNWTMYVSPYMVVNADRFTKHYYAGSQRIASKIGAGDFNNLYDASKACVTAGQKDYAERMNLITQSRNDYYTALGIPPGPPTAKGIYGEAEYSGKYGDYVIEPLGDYSVPTGWPMKPYKRPYGGTPGPPVMYEKPSDPEEESAGYGYSNGMSQQEHDVFYYHSDHLGSTSYITDANGEATQFVCYKPYGEALVDEHNTTFEQPWKFNGKELDSETGLYYYGARYYEPVLAMWYGVDALTDKAPNMSPYMYCFASPVRLIDPNGKWPWENRNVRNARNYTDKHGGTFQRWEGKNGMTYASVTSTSQDNIGITVTAKFFKPTKQEQHNALWNIMEAIDIPEGHADGALQGNITQQDIKVGFGIMGTIAGLMSLGSSELVLGPGTVIGVLGTANSLDDAFTNENGQSMTQQLFESNGEVIGMGKNVISIASIGNDFLGIFMNGNLVNVIDAVNGTVAVINEIKNQISDGNNE